MKKININLKKNFQIYIRNKYAILGLPMRLTVSVIIASVSIVAILAFILNPCLFPGKTIVSVNPLVNIIDSGNSKEFSIDFNVTDKDGRPIVGAQIILKGLGGVGNGQTDVNGKKTIKITPVLQTGQNEGYLDITVKCGCFETFSQKSMIKVIRG